MSDVDICQDYTEPAVVPVTGFGPLSAWNLDKVLYGGRKTYIDVTHQNETANDVIDNTTPFLSLSPFYTTTYTITYTHTAAR